LKTVAVPILLGKSHNIDAEKYRVSPNLMIFIIKAYLLLQQKDDKRRISNAFPRLGVVHKVSESGDDVRYVQKGLVRATYLKGALESGHQNGEEKKSAAAV
jgi:hypothetical protein